MKTVCRTVSLIFEVNNKAMSQKMLMITLLMLMG